MTALVHAPTQLTWRLLIAAPAPLWSANDAHKKGPHATSANRTQWRLAAYQAAQQARLPKRLQRVRFAFTFHFTDRRRRDALNYADTAKPLVDGFGPPFVQAPTAGRPAGVAAPGWTLIPDDTPEYLESTSLAVGPLWRDVLAGIGPSARRRLASPFGGVTVVVTDLSSRAAA
jgi:hypothetical protein